MSTQNLSNHNIPVLTEIVVPPPGIKLARPIEKPPTPEAAPSTPPPVKEELSVQSLLGMMREAILSDLQQKVDARIQAQLEVITPKLMQMIQKEVTKVIQQEIEQILSAAIEEEQKKFQQRPSK